MTFRRRRPDDWATSHARARAALSDRLDDVLEPGEAAWLDDHLAGCPDCRGVAASYDQQRSALRALRADQPTPPRDLWARTAASIERESGGRTRRRPAPTRSTLRSPLLATALVVIVAAGTLISSRFLGGGGTTAPGSSVVTGLASSNGASGLPPTATPIAVAERVQFISQDQDGRYRVTSWNVSAVCPSGASKCSSGAPVEDQPVQLDAKPESVFGSSDGRRLIVISHSPSSTTSSVSVVPVPSAGPAASATPQPATSTGPSETPIATSAPTSTASPVVTATATVAPTPSATPKATPSSQPTETPPASPSSSATPTVSITPSANPDGSIQIADNVVLVGQSAAYSPSGDWFAFTARPADGSTGPDIFLWKVGEPEAHAVTSDHASVFGSWVGEVVVASTVAQAPGDPPVASGSPAAVPSQPSAGPLLGTSFLLDPTTGHRIEIARGERTWRPTVDPSGHRAVYWTGSLQRAASAPVYVPADGRLVIGDWDVASSGTSASPSGVSGSSSGAEPSDGSASTSSAASDGSTGASTAPPGLSGSPDVATLRHETTIETGPVSDWDARWDGTGTKLAVWIADPVNPGVGTLSLYAIDPFDGRIDVKKPLLDSTPATAGFSMSDGKLVWAEPSTDGSGAGRVLVLAWTDKGAGTVETLSDQAVVIR